MVWLLELTWVLIFLSILLFFYHFLHMKHVLKIWAQSTMIGAAVLQTIVIIVSFLQEGSLPLFNRIDLMLTYSYLLILVAIGVHYWIKVDMAVAFLLSLSLLMFWIYFLGSSFSFAYENQYNYLVKQMFVHIFFSIISYCLYAVSFVFSIIYIVQAKWLKEKKITKLFSRFQSLESIENYAYLFLLLGLPFLFLSIMIGIVFMYLHFGTIQWFDLKIVGSFTVLVLYSMYLLFRYRNIMGVKQLCYWNIGCFLIVLLNLFLFSSLSNFHLWY